MIFQCGTLNKEPELFIRHDTRLSSEVTNVSNFCRIKVNSFYTQILPVAGVNEKILFIFNEKQQFNDPVAISSLLSN